MQPGKQKDEPGMGIPRQNDARMQNLEPGCNLATQKQHAEYRSPGCQAKKGRLVVLLQPAARRFKNKTTREEHTSADPKHVWDTNVSPKLLAA